MGIIKKYINFLKENTIAPSRPKIAPPPQPPVKPERKKDKTIKEPKVKPDTKASKKLSEEVAYTFVAEMSKVGQSVEKYLK